MNHAQKKLSSAYLWFRALTVLWMVFIYIASNQSTVLAPPLFPGLDKLMHMITYGVLGLLLLLSLKQWRKHLTWKTVWFITLVTLLYGLSDEYHQSFVPGRYPSLADVIADGLGGFIAVTLARYQVLKKQGRKICKN